MPDAVTDSPVQPESSLTDRLAGLLHAEGLIDAPEPDSQPEATEEAQATTDPSEATAEADTEHETKDAEPEGQTESEDDGTEEVEVEGKQYRVPKELKDHLMRDRDYRHKTMELAEERKLIQAVKPLIEQAYQAATQMPQLVGAITAVEQQVAEYDKALQADPNMRSNDPMTYNTLQIERRNLLDQRNSLANQFAQANSKMQQVRATEFAQEVQRNAPIVRRAIKDWGPDTQKAIAAYANEQGFTTDEISGLTDARAVVVLNKARLYDKLVAERDQTTKKVASVPPVAKKAAPKAISGEIEYNKALARLKKSGGDPEDVVAALRAMRQR